MKSEDLSQKLAFLDFSPNDIDVYLALISAGQSPVGPLIKDTRLHRNIVYTSLDHLVARKLVSESKVKGKKNYSPASPGALSDEFARKAQTAKDAVSLISSRIKSMPQEITVHTGNDEYLALLSSLLLATPLQGDAYVLGTGGESFMANTMRPIWKPYHDIATKRKIKVHMLSYEAQREALATDIQTYCGYDVRYLRDEVENPAGILIYPGAKTVVHVIYSNNHLPVTGIKIKSEALATGYLNLFKNLWKTALP